MAPRRRIENPVADVSNDEAVNFFFQNAAGELTNLYSLALDRHIAFDAGTRYAFMSVNEWIESQLQNGVSVTAAELLAYLQDMLNQLDSSNALGAQQQVEIEQSATEVLLEDDIHNAHQMREQLANGTQSGESGDAIGNPSGSQVKEMEINN